VRSLGIDSHVVFGQKFPRGKGSVRLCVVLMQQPVLLSTKFGGKSSYIFKQSPYNVTVLRRIYCLAYQNEFFENNSVDIKKSDEFALDFALHLSRLFRSALN
jgi:hypothetical protein